jgi:hypothetical protein
MKPLIVIPFAGAVLAALGMLFVADTGATYHRAVLIAIALVTAVSAFVTAARFSRGDRLLLCWLLVGCGYGLAAARYVMRLVTILWPAVVFNQTMLDAMLVIQNVLIAVSLLLFVRVWRATGLAVPGSSGARAVSILVGIAVAIVVGGYPLMKGIHGASTDLVLLVSTLGDMVGIALIVPLAMPALALRGGVLMHTWVFLAASEASWLLYDVWYALRVTYGFGLRSGRGVEEGIRALAILFALVASMAQRRAISR